MRKLGLREVKTPTEVIQLEGDNTNSVCLISVPQRNHKTVLVNYLYKRSQPKTSWFKKQILMISLSFWGSGVKEHLRWVVPAEGLS